MKMAGPRSSRFTIEPSCKSSVRTANPRALPRKRLWVFVT
jgi:hypothetical protein